MDWKPIATAPRDGTLVLLFSDDRGDNGRLGPSMGYWDGELWRTFHGDDYESDKYGPHWWMPTPAPPPADVVKVAEKRYSDQMQAVWTAVNAPGFGVIYVPAGQAKSFPGIPTLPELTGSLAPKTQTGDDR